MTITKNIFGKVKSIEISYSEALQILLDPIMFLAFKGLFKKFNIELPKN